MAEKKQTSEKKRATLPTADVVYNCTGRTLILTNITANGGCQPVWIWARVDPGSTPPPSLGRHPYEHGAVKKPVDLASGSAILTRNTWPNSGPYTIHYWFDFGFALVTTEGACAAYSPDPDDCDCPDDSSAS